MNSDLSLVITSNGGSSHSENLPAAAANPWSKRAEGAGDTVGDDQDLYRSRKSDHGDESESSSVFQRAILFWVRAGFE